MSANAETSELLSVPEAAARLHKSERTIRRYIATGKLNTIELNGQTYVQMAGIAKVSAVSAPHVIETANADNMTGTMSELRDRIEEGYKDRIRWLEAENSRLWDTLNRFTAALPAPAARKRNLWPYVAGAFGVALVVLVVAITLQWIP